MVPYRHARHLDAENPIYRNLTYSYVDLDCPQIPGESWTHVRGLRKVMVADIARVATVDVQDRVIELPLKMGIPVHRATVEWIERAKHQPLDPARVPPRHIVARQNICS